MTDNVRHQTTDNRDGRSAAVPVRPHYSFRDLAVWQKAQELSLLILALVRELPSDRASAIIAQQVLRSATSIAANVAEGHGRFTPAAYRNHLSIARGSANETVNWIDLLRRAGYISAEREQQLNELCSEVLRMISAQMIALGKSVKAQQAATARSRADRR